MVANLLRHVAVVGGTLLWLAATGAAFVKNLPPDAAEVVDTFEREAAEIERRLEAEIGAVQEQAAVQLKEVQDQLCREARLDEAVAVRDQIRLLRGGTVGRAADLPPAAKEILGSLETKAARIEGRCEEEFAKITKRAAEPLTRMQDELCRQAKLDEAVAVRDQLRRIRGGGMSARPDPGNLQAQPSDVGQVWYFEVTGSNSGSIYGTDVYTSDSHLGTCAVHAGILQVGQKGVVKVTILPGAQNYASSTRHGVTSYPYGAYSVSFQVHRVYARVKPQP